MPKNIIWVMDGPYGFCILCSWRFIFQVSLPKNVKKHRLPFSVQRGLIVYINKEVWTWLMFTDKGVEKIKHYHNAYVILEGNPVNTCKCEITYVISLLITKCCLLIFLTISSVTTSFFITSEHLRALPKLNSGWMRSGCLNGQKCNYSCNTYQNTEPK